MPETEHMTLQRTNWPDVDDIVALNADDEVMRYRGDGRPMTAARVLSEEMPRLMAHNQRADRLGCWVARDRPTGNFLGWFTVTPVDEPVRTVELGYRLRRRAWGKGYCREGALLMLEMARAARVSTVIATAVADDLEYRQVLEQVGLQIVRTQVWDGTIPTGPAGDRAVHYGLDLAVGAALPA